MKKTFIFIVFIVSLIYARPATDWCGTIPALEEYRAGKRPVRPSLSGPEILISRTNFIVHYTQQGADAVSTAYAETTANAMEYSWHILVDSLGWAPPPPDYNQGGDNRYDIYIKELSSGIAGVTYSENSYSNPYPDGVCSHFRITRGLDNNYLKSTVCHEFHHSIQFRYSANEGSWWMENSATWSEEVVYPDYNDYLGFLSTSPGPFTTPEYPINTFNNVYQYAGCVWPMYLSERFDNEIVRRMWTYQGTIGGQNTLSGMDYILSTQYGSNLINALKEYSVWRYFTGSRADSVQFYKESRYWPQVRITRSHIAYPASGDQGNFPVTNPGGTSYIQFQNGGGDLITSFNAQSVYRWKCNLVGYRPNNLSTVREISLNSAGAGSDSVPWLENEHFTMIPVACQWEYNTGALPFSYNADLRIMHDVGVTQLTGFSPFVDSGAVINPVAVVKNYGISYESFPITLSIGNFYLNTYNLNLNAGDSVIVNFTACTLITRDYQDYKCQVVLATDQRKSNDSILGRTFVRVKDIGVTSITAPTGNIIQGTLVQPRAVIKNYGNLRENFDVDFRIGDWLRTQRFGLNAGLEYEFVFDSIWPANMLGDYTVKCSTKLASDINASNNYAITTCNVTSSAVAEQTTETRQLPTIIFNRNQINVTGISNAKQINLEIYDVQGQRLYNAEHHSLPINIHKALPAGCYIIRLNLDGMLVQTKSVLVK